MAKAKVRKRDEVKITDDHVSVWFSDGTVVNVSNSSRYLVAVNRPGDGDSETIPQ